MARFCDCPTGKPLSCIRAMSRVAPSGTFESVVRWSVGGWLTLAGAIGNPLLAKPINRSRDIGQMIDSTNLPPIIDRTPAAVNSDSCDASYLLELFVLTIRFVTRVRGITRVAAESASQESVFRVTRVRNLAVDNFVWEPPAARRRHKSPNPADGLIRG